MTPYGHPDTQYPQPLQMSCCTTTVPNSVRNSAPVGQTSRQAACVQCLQTSDDISQRTPSLTSCSMNATWRHVSEPRATVLSNDIPVKPCNDCGTWFHS